MLPSSLLFTRLDAVNFYFRNTAENEWSILGEEIIDGNSLSGFKRKLDDHLRDMTENIYV